MGKQTAAAVISSVLSRPVFNLIVLEQGGKAVSGLISVSIKISQLLLTDSRTCKFQCIFEHSACGRMQSYPSVPGLHCGLHPAPPPSFSVKEVGVGVYLFACER